MNPSGSSEPSPIVGPPCNCPDRPVLTATPGHQPPCRAECHTSSFAFTVDRASP
jgi:hypothetical protein